MDPHKDVLLIEATIDELIHELQDRCKVSLVCFERQDAEEQTGYFFDGYYLTLLGFAERCRLEIQRKIDDWEDRYRTGSDES